MLQPASTGAIVEPAGSGWARSVRVRSAQVGPGAGSVPPDGRSSLSGPLTPSERSVGGRSSGGVRERPNRHDWKSCVGKLTVGSNPTASAMEMSSTISDDAAMDLAMIEAAKAPAHGDVPVGAVAVHGNRVIAARHNEREHRGDPTAHAELLALADAATAIGGWRLSDVTLFVTLEPCPMCAGGLVAARLGRLVFGAFDPKSGACGSLYNLCVDPRLNHEVVVVGGLRAGQSAALLSEFFDGRRAG